MMREQLTGAGSSAVGSGAGASGLRPVEPAILRRGAERGHFDFGWLDTRHTFSFGEYWDRRWMGFRQLRVINDDRVKPGEGFPTHPHRDMEIVTWVLDGALEHRDSVGTGSVIRAGEVQRMTAGTGITHSEFNASDTEPLRFLQIWMRPEQTGLTPGYAQRAIPEEDRHGRLRLVASRDGRDGSITLAQDADLLATLLSQGDTVQHLLREGRHVWVQVARGKIAVNGHAMAEGDGFAASGPGLVQLEGLEAAEALLFDLA